MITIPERIILANLPTKIEKLERISAQLQGPSIYIKRDDQTGTELSGNKIRKLEYCIREAIDQGCDTLITCGGIQSNHCRATAAAAAKLGLKAIVVLRGHDPDTYEGNLLLDHLLGAEVCWISSEDYRDHRMDIMHTIADEVSAKGQQAYVIPEGASSGIGAFGYFSALQEIVQQEQELGISFDAVIVAVGSGGTHGGLLLAQQLLPTSHRIIGINVCDDEDYFIKAITTVIEESAHYLDQSVTIPTEAIEIIDGYVGKGYAQSQPQELQCIKDLASLEGVILDPVYTGKAFYGLVEEIRKGTFQDLQNILFIHTGGLYGLFPHSASFEF
ncbi:D-cysteine desulfhydrase family protein [Paenibacillus sp. CFBP13512]|uniref:D-cysteine desulfhydrase family protein n=1 Tax=Paenibacillus sp. CFBP13512 TaxID=2184007 RepID=UPI0010BFD40C|nr:D-cysteine desulfhydrase family protein [Paenibacillus sp. CFBP13512]TKJ92264.1 D-cysteine desulfhydrase family protein [Paenibacillus sp. CFBP13512]